MTTSDIINDSSEDDNELQVQQANTVLSEVLDVIPNVSKLYMLRSLHTKLYKIFVIFWKIYVRILQNLCIKEYNLKIVKIN